MKKIETLVEDIYSLFTYDPIKMDEKEVDKHIDTFGEMLKVHIKAFLYEEPRTRGNLRLSAIGKPDRRLWYDINSKKKVDDISPSTRIQFLYGYILEEFLLLCASISGHTVTDQQKELVVEGVKGHQDAIIDGVLVDCKSASSFSFKKFKDNSLVDKYIKTNDEDSFIMARKLIQEEGLLIGGSCGAAVWGAIEAAKDLDENKNVLVILPDSIRNYLSKFVNDEWMKNNSFMV